MPKACRPAVNRYLTTHCGKAGPRHVVRELSSIGDGFGRFSLRRRGQVFRRENLRPDHVASIAQIL